MNTKKTEMESFNLTASNHTSKNLQENSNIEKLSQKFKNACKAKASFEDIFIDEESFQQLFDSKDYQKITESLLRFVLHSSNLNKNSVRK
jgi:hypothetical protein